MHRLTAPYRRRQQLQRHSVALDADLHGSLRAVDLLLLCKATLVFLQQAQAFLIALQRTNHSAANDLTSCVHSLQHQKLLSINCDIYSNVCLGLNQR